MIQIYKAFNTDQTRNGDMVLMPSAAITHAVLNGSWSAELTHPIDPEGRWKYIEEEAIVEMPSFNGKQLYRIRSEKKTVSTVQATMEPVFFDSIDDCWLEDVRPTNKTGQEALDIMLESNPKYSAKSDIDKLGTAYYEYQNFMEALNSNQDNSFINRWGGEILFDNYEIIVNSRVGEDRGVEIRYGKNIKKDGISEEVSTGNTVTRIYPKAYNGYKMSGKGYVDSPLLRKYPTVKTITMTFSDVKMAEDAQEGDEEKGIIICNSQDELDQALKMKCENQYSNGLDKPSVTISVDMVLTGNTEEYKQYRKLEEISLGDTVHCRNARLGIVTDARVIELKYNSILKRVESVVIGDYSYNYFNNVSSTVNRVQNAIRSDGTVVAEQVYGAINTLNAFLHAQSTAAKRTDSVAYLIENLDQNSELYGAMEAGTQGLRLAKERKDGEWIWRTAVTAAGIIADLIVTGKIQDRLGKSYWDLDNGKMLLSGIFQQITDNGKKSVDIKNNRINIYSWQKEGDYVGSIGSLAIRDDLNEKQRIGVYCDTEDMLVFGYSSKKTAEGDAATVHELMKLSKDGGIECTEIPQINGTKTGRLVFSNGTYVNVKNGYIVGGKTEEGSF
ncbi:phage tail spike protein [Mediterraneibacter faecis]|uniref:phage tail spike protein n=1 Tax=Mediterraneibacter faecis TaxID=592978 RepID=UPI0032C01D0F